MRRSLLDSPQSAVGEIGLDGARCDPITRDLCAPMDRQVEAFEMQLHIAVDLERPVSIHAVRAWGPLLETLNKNSARRREANHRACAFMPLEARLPRSTKSMPPAGEPTKFSMDSPLA